MKKLLILSVLATFGRVASAQSISHSNMEWHVAEASFFNSSDLVRGGKLTSSNGSSIKWFNEAGDLILDMTTQQSVGTWSDVNSSGYIAYRATSGDKRGTITFERNGADITIRIVLVEGDKEPEIYELKISQVVVL